MAQSIKFQWNGIKVDGKLVRCFFSKGGYTAQSGLSDDVITIYAKSILDGLPRLDGLTVENGTDLLTDYFESDHCRVTPESPWYSEALSAYEAAEAHYAKLKAKREARWEARRNGSV